ncbi:MAG TPA: transglutaminase family protein [Euzebya sp.]|nr:transglutaminase family protein [Euzebya sp.]
MAIHVALTHRTTYDYDRVVGLGPHVVRLRPAPHTRTPILAYSLTVQPEDNWLNWQQDAFGNYLARLVFHEKADKLELVVDMVADMTTINPFDFFIDETAETYPFAYDPSLAKDLSRYTSADTAGPRLTEWLQDRTGDLVADAAEGMRTIDVLVALNQRLQSDIAYTTRMEPGVQTPEQTLDKALGSCRDSGWLLAQIMRQMGLAARFVSGYLVQLKADVAALDGPSGTDVDFTDLHAWTEVFLPGAGWVGMDPTSGLFAGEGHIPLACTPEPRSAAPVEGAVDEAEVSFSHANLVTRIHEDPRVTKPYTLAQWEAIDQLGRQVDVDLQAADVRLTQGGEPTFVSVDDMESPQWNTAADGHAKRERAWDLSRRLFDRFAEGGLIHHGQGKWYPGEPLPRWQTGLYWRADGQPLWHDPKLLADPWQPGDVAREVAGTFARRLAEAFGVPADNVHAAHEDELYRLWMEATLPVGPPPELDTDPTDDRLVDPDERRRLAAALDVLDTEPGGYAVPLHHDGTTWATARWRFRRGRLVLMPGDSPMGLRLPLPGLSWHDAAPQPDRSTFQQRAELRPPAAMDGPARPQGQAMSGDQGAAAEGPGAGIAAAPARQIAIDDGPFSAVCVEVREGRLHVFFPPLTHLEHTLDLLDVVQGIAGDLSVPLVLEGYEPPGDPRLRKLVIAPDPGVIEVNVQPAADWEELSAIVEGVYDDAHHARLGTEKFDLDGSHTGSGGGNHVTLGGATPADSPLLRRPDLLRSMVTYWQHHPSLSYLFSGKFVGPTSQAPRVDEGRTEVLHELETAFAELDRVAAQHDGHPPAWVVDRALRHLLTDLTGNTHRAEFCIDKLYSPDSERGRLGLVELRAFEMPPHPQMALVQSLLVRSLVSRFWHTPYTGPLVRWGGLLHDRFLLPWFAQADAREVVTDLQAHGYAFDDTWLDPFVEFRFPRMGTAVVDDVEIELRKAVEPWNVLGEEATGSGTARYVDSSVERMQVKVAGLTPGRHVVTCNGVPVPLTPTTESGTAVGAVRFKAWQPPSGLHPTIGVQSPLTFDLVDRWNRRSLGGARYHVVHQGGLGYDRMPVNAFEADSRRVNRFEQLGHTPGPIDIEALDRMGSADAGEYPRTLDLRRPRV